MRDSNDQVKPFSRATTKRLFPLIVGAVTCFFFGAAMALGVYMLWQLDDLQATSSLEEQMMHRKTRTMTQILDGLVRGDLRRVERSAEHMWRLGQRLDWYLSSSLYEKTNEMFRDSTRELIAVARQGDHVAAKESALRLERSCIECHAFINAAKNPTP